MVVGVVAVCAFTSKTFQFDPMDRRRSLIVLFLAGLLLVAMFLDFYGGSAPAKKFHVFQYGVLAYLMFSAVRTEPPDTRGIWLSVFVILLVGVVDESIQAVLPQRFFAVKDIIGNWAGAGIGFMCWVSTSAVSPWRSRVK